MKQELQVGALNNCIRELQKQAYAQRLELQDAQQGYIESRREQIRLQEELSMKEKVLRDTQIRHMHEMGEMKRAQELRVDEVSVQRLGENHETIQKLTSQLQEVQEQMNSMNDSGEFQEVESNYSVRLSYVSSQPAIIPCSRSMLSRDKRLTFDTLNTSGLQENVFGNQFSTLDSPRDHPQGIHPCATSKRTRISSTSNRDGDSFQCDPEWRQRKPMQSPARVTTVKEHGPNKALPVIDEPLIADALLLKRSGEEFLQMRLACIPQDKSALDDAKNIALFSAAICGELATGRQSGDGVGLMLPLGPGRRLGKVSAQSGTNVGPLSVAKNVDKVQISRDQRLERAVEHQRFNRASPVCHDANHAQAAAGRDVQNGA